MDMHSMTASEAREKLYAILDETAAAHEPRSNAVLVGEEDWNAIQETLREGLDAPVDECEKEPGW